MSAALTWDAALAFRMRRQHLVQRAPASALLDVARDLRGLHAQVLSSAAGAAHARVDGLDPGAVAEALWETRSLVKTWAMRGTLHLFGAADLPRLVAALSHLPPRHRNGAWLRANALSQEAAEAILAAIPEVLRAGPVSREALAAQVAERVGNPTVAAAIGGSWGMMLKPAAFAGELVFADSDGQRVRFVAPAAWLGAQAPVDPDEGGRWLMRGYLGAYGPVTRDEVARWIGTPSKPLAARLVGLLGDEVAEVEVDGEPRWVLTADVEEMAAAQPEGVVRLLPAFDPYVVAALKTPAVLDPARRALVSRQAGWITPAVVVDGRIAGVWEASVARGRLAVTVTPFGRLPAGGRAALKEEAARWAPFHGAEAATVTVVKAA